MPKGICSQAGVVHTDCDLAKRKVVQEATEERLICSECGEPLERQPDKPPSPPYMKYAAMLVVIVGLAIGTYFAWSFLHRWSVAESDDTQLKSEPDPLPSAVPACEEQLRQSFVSIPARQSVQLVPEGVVTTTDQQRRYNTFRNWLEDKRIETTFSSDAFYIQRFEVSIGAFKAYVDQLADSKRISLPEPLQQLMQEGDSVLPVGYISPEVAQAYADWLKPSFAACFAQGFSVSIPSERQWMSALYGGLDHPQDIATLAAQQPTGYQAVKEGIVYHLLANQREWLRGGDCPTGKYLRTQYSYKTGAEYMANFMPALSCAWADAAAPYAEDGFRVVIEGQRVAPR